MRRVVGPDYPIGMKLNSADFQRGGFSADESIEVARALSSLGMDLIEISGGTYEAPAMTGRKAKDSTLAREAYFLEYCEQIRKVVKTPLLLTGGFRSLAGMEEALKSGACDVIGLARSLAVEPEFSNALLQYSGQGKSPVSVVHPLTTGVQALDQILPLEITWYTKQIHRMGAGLDPDPKLGVYRMAFETVFSMVASLAKSRN